MRGKQAPPGSLFCARRQTIASAVKFPRTKDLAMDHLEPKPTPSLVVPPGTTAEAGSSTFAMFVALSALSVLPVNIIAPSLPNIAREFGADAFVINLAVAGYALVTAFVGLISCGLLDRFGWRPVALASIGLFAAASVGCAVATDIVTFLLCRAAQAAIAACFSVALVGIKSTSNAQTGASRMGYAAMVWAVAPMIGPTLGGTLDAFFGWRSIFLGLAAAGTIVLFLSGRRLPEAAERADRPGYLGAYGQLLRSARFWAYVLCMTFSMGTLYIFLAGAPLAIGGSSAVLGLYMGLVPAGFICGSFLAGRIGARFARGRILVLARTLTCLGLLACLGLAAIAASHPLAFFVPCMFIGVGNGLTMPTANMGVMSIRHDLPGTAAGLSAAMSIGGGALVVSVAGLFFEGHGAIAALATTMLASALLALLAAAIAAWLDRDCRSA